MPSCPRCGAAMSSSADVCPACGARSYSGSGGQKQVAYVKELPSTGKPISVNAFSGLAIIGAIGAFLLSASINIIPKISSLSQFGIFGALSPYFLALVGIISLGAAYGSFKRTHWAWKIGFGASVLELLSIFTPNLLGFVVGIISLFLLTTKPVKNWLRK